MIEEVVCCALVCCCVNAAVSVAMVEGVSGVFCCSVVVSVCGDVSAVLWSSVSVLMMDWYDGSGIDGCAV